MVRTIKVHILWHLYKNQNSYNPDRQRYRKIDRYIQCVKKLINRIGFQSHHMEKIWDNLDMIGYKNYSLNYIRTFILLNFLYFTVARFDDLKHIRVNINV